ncbi:MAG: hypothetical protein PF549_04415 [Patescibacteria group bacterium]|nr:hypothetical protein [Patescibacteria group bacterium]
MERFFDYGRNNKFNKYMKKIPFKLKIEIYNAPPIVPVLMLSETGLKIENLITKTKPTYF